MPIKPNLLNIDLNLLVAFDAMMVENHVSRAAARIGISQPTMSRSLQSLREIFGDVLFERTKEGIRPTPRARDLDRLIRPGLEVIERAIGQKSAFDPAFVKRRFVFAMTDMASYLVVPPVMRALRRLAPSIDIEVRNASPQKALEMAESGTVEFAVGTFDYVPSTIKTLNLQPLQEICIADEANPFLQSCVLDLDLFLSLPHVAVSMEGQHGTPIDIAIETLGYQRRIALTVPHFLAVPSAVVGTDMLAVVVESLLDRLPERSLVKRCKLPLPFEPVMGRIAWHRRFDFDAGHQWMRDLIERTIHEVLFGAPGG
ncbi:DNA-binding transcriptional LysR family regulator [Novosphingobium chloroacetimidivorans]|uniref:DNA-binding transcriptional LysR family regulator n=1 Tax=Novosphingobium chloroacetimidivorans TaxID=1428314 RepID=A0A7W7KDX7_9SPHN|nr:LysR family transcriptional regulator [Novosphingobium chloroacetimidivorans]MBB4860298.1 DNA-binding transcriptional LysR family regulator [Novosphingobium chloroacetimidivorans]